MKGRPIIYSAEEMAWLEANRGLVIGQYHAQFCATFARDDVSAANLHALRKRKGWLTGRTGQFAKGHQSWNKGKPFPSRGRSAETQFKKGGRTGRAAQVYRPIGSERLSKEGYIQRKIHDGLPFQSRWRGVHLINWEEANGPLRAGMCLKCLDGDRTNTAADNWEAVPRALLPRLNGRFGRDYDSAPAELKPTILAAAKLKHRAHTVIRKPNSGGDAK